MIYLSGYSQAGLLRSEAEFELRRGRRESDQVPVLFFTILQAHPAPGTLERLDHELSLKEVLDPAWAVRPISQIREKGFTALVLEDPGGEPLDRLLEKPFDLTDSLKIAIGASSALAQVHERGLIHKDIKPANLLVNPITGQVHLMGFGIATRSSRERQEPEPPESLVGTLAYMAPEQTGRMNRSMDFRSDLYSLGVTLYELFTGALPFTAQDPMEWVHCHIARQPIPPAERAQEIPLQVSAIILKLLAKTAEDRYQTAEGLGADLKRSLAEWVARRRIDPFPLGEHDASNRLLIPEKLYGRERDRKALLDAFDRVVGSGNPELMLVSGYAGIGKSSLVNEMQKAIVLSRGLYASGKFDQYKRNIPYDTLAQAFRTLVRQILAKGEEDVAMWREAIREAVGKNGRLLVGMLPEIEVILGEQAPVPELPPQEAQNRFYAVLRRFLSVFARKEHPLALFLDDLQWQDAASLKLMEYLVSRSELQYFLLIGAYRDNEVHPSHPLMLTLDSIRKNGAIVHEIVLKPLSLKDVGALLSDTLLGARDRVKSLARLVHGKTAGNPFFVIQFLSALFEEGLLEFDAAAGAWRWDVGSIKAKGFTENIVDLMIGKLQRLPLSTLDILKQFACLGNAADIAALTKVQGGSEQRVHEDLWNAVQAGLVLKQGNTYRFLHDRVHEAAYTLIPEATRAREHLRIGRLLLAGLSEKEIDDMVFHLADQFNRGIGLITDPGEKKTVRRLNFLAGEKAMAAIAYASARNYLTQVLAILPQDAWEQEYQDTLPLMLALSECEHLVGNFARSEEIFRIILGHARTNSDRAQAYRLRVKLHQMEGNHDHALKTALEGLRCFGMSFPESDEDVKEAIKSELGKITARMENGRISDLAGLPEASNPDERAILGLITVACPSAAMANPGSFPMLALKGVNLSLQYGNTKESCLLYSYYAYLVAALFDDHASAFDIFTQVSLPLSEKFKDEKNTVSKGPLLVTFATTINFWQKHFAISRTLLESAFIECISVGDFVFAGYASVGYPWLLLEEGVAFNKSLEALEKHLAFAKLSHSDLMQRVLPQYGRFLACMQGTTEGLTSFDGDGFNEADCLAFFAQAGFTTGIAHHHVLKQVAAFTFERYDESLEYASLAEGMLFIYKTQVPETTHQFYHALALAALYPKAIPAKQSEFSQLLGEKLKTLKVWADDCPENFLSRYALVSAEFARIEGRDLEAMRLYDQAVASARENGFVQIESMANEIAARFYFDRGFEKIANGYLRDARLGYLRWGALGKVKQLDGRYRGIQAPAPLGDTATIGASLEELDLMTVIKTSQAVSGEIVLGSLVEKLLSILVENAGAERGLLILAKNGVQTIEAEAVTEHDRIEVHFKQAPVSPEALPVSVFNITLRTMERVILQDASAPNPYSDDAYIRLRHPRSVLCLPLAKQGRLIAILYLENNLTPGAFTPNRIAMLNILTFQAAISLENARLYLDLVEEQSRLQAVIRQVPAGLVIAEAPSGRLVTANDKVDVIMHGSFRHSASIQQYGEYVGIHPDGRRYTPEEWPLARSISRGEMVDGEELEMLWPDGSRSWLSLSSSPIRNAEGRISAGVVILQDITERKRREDALRMSEERFSKAFHFSPTPMAITLMEDGSFVDANEKFLETFGYVREEFLGRTAMELGIADQEVIESAVRMVNETGGIRNVEFLVRTKSGEPRTLLTSVESIELDGNRCSLTTYLDMTERNLVEEQLRQSQKMEAIGRLAGGVAHDFNNLLTAINGYSTMAMEVMDPTSTAYGFIKEVVKAGEKAAILTRQLLAHSRKQVLQTKVWNLNVIVEDMVPMLGRLISEDVQLGTVLDPFLGLAKVDRGQVEQIILNLVVNARDAMPQGGRLSISTGMAHLDPAYIGIHPEAVVGPHVMLSVSDMGTGMTPEVKARIFEPFFTTKPEGKGTGLGLSVVYGIVKQSGGSISVYSELGLGTVIRIYFPEVRQVPDALLKPLPVEKPGSYRGQETILLVEDMESVRTFARLALESQGYTVLDAETGLQALKVVAGAKIDAVVTDVVMPEMGGVALVKELRERWPSLPVLFISGFVEHDGIHGGIVQTGESLLQKPFSPWELARKVREILDRA